MSDDTEAARQALARQMWEADGGNSFPFDEVAPHRLADAYRQADIALAYARSLPAAEEIKAAYKQGWNDRESDILERADSMGLPDPIPAAAALLRKAGWTVQEPRNHTPHLCDYPTCSKYGGGHPLACGCGPGHDGTERWP